MNRRVRSRVRWRQLAPALTLWLIPVAAAEPAHAIANGVDALDGQFSFATKLTMTGIPDGSGRTRDSSCSGGLVAPRWVLTAGHCFRDIHGRNVAKLVAKRTVATIGRADLTGTHGEQATVVGVHQSKVADVALAELSRPITDITPMRVNQMPPVKGQRVRLAGFGLLDGDDTEVTDRMQLGLFTVTSVAPYVVGVSGTSPSRTTSPCKHDSGGPYFIPDRLSAVVVGVVSNGPTCPHAGPDHSSRIDAVAPWILSVIGKDLVKPSRSPSPAASPSAMALTMRGPDGTSAMPVALEVTGGAAGLMIVAAAGVHRRRRRRRR